MSLFAAALGWGLCSGLRAKYREWKAARPSVPLTKGRNGVYRDPLDLLEKRLFLAVVLAAVLIVVGVEIMLFQRH